MKTTFKLVLTFALLIITFACSDDDDPVKAPDNLKEVKILAQLKVSEIKRTCQMILLDAGMPANEVTAFVARFKYDVELAMVDYDVKDPFGHVRTLSGVVSYPMLPDSEKNKKLRIYANTHGTIGFNADAPSQDLCSIQMNFIMHFPSHENGYIGVFPDYFGYGTDTDQMHYYEHRETLASATRELIDYVPEYVKQKSLQVDFDKLYIIGYSEGGFAALSTLKSYSETPSPFKDFVTLGEAGAYDTKETLKYIFQQAEGTSEFVASYAWAVMTYDKAYQINRDYNQYFQAEFVPELRKHEGKNSIFEGIDQLPSIPSEIFTADFMKGITEGTDEAFVKALDDNDVSNFDAKGKVYLVHGDQDPWVPSFNTDVAYDRLKARGVNVEKEIIEGGDHHEGTPLFFTLRLIEELNK